MRKYIIFSILLSLILPIQNANAVQISCPKSKVGQIINNKICTKIGSVYRLVEIAKPTIKPVPLSTTASSTVVELSHYSISYKELDSIIYNDTNIVNVNLIVSDNAKKRSYLAYLDALNIAIKTWGPVFNNDPINVILFTEQDSEWIDATQSKLMGNFLSNPTSQLQSYRIKQYGCGMAGFYLPNIILACVTDNNLASSSTALAHEYTHLVGMTSKQITNLGIGDKKRLLPCWIEEGSATFYGFYSESKLDPEFNTNRSFFLNYLYSGIKDNSKQGILAIFKDKEQTMDTCTNVDEAYFLGSISFEQLSYKYGNKKVINFYKDLHSNYDWKILFFNTFGITVDSFYDTMANIVVAKQWNA